MLATSGDTHLAVDKHRLDRSRAWRSPACSMLIPGKRSQGLIIIAVINVAWALLACRPATSRTIQPPAPTSSDRFA